VKFERLKIRSHVTNLKQIDLAFRIWPGDQSDKYPMQVSVANGVAMELIATENVAACFQVMSNELSTPKILTCPADISRFAAEHFATGFSNAARDSVKLILDKDSHHKQS
jgi:hypothetical protein